MNNAWKEAERLTGLLPRNGSWSFTITDLEDDAVLNIYMDQIFWDSLRLMLGLDRVPAETGVGYMTWYNGSLAVSLIQPEEEDGPDTEHDARLFG